MNEISEKVYKDNMVRLRKRQKKAFEQLITDECQRRNIPCRVEQSPIVKSRNIVAGNLEKAKVIFTAHYDTQAELPFPNLIFVGSMWKFLAAQLFMGLMMCIAIFLPAAVLSAAAVRITDSTFAGLMVFEFLIWFTLFMMFFGKANKNTANDNTSGVCVLSELLFSKEFDSEKVAVVFFDNEEMGLLGSSYFKKLHGKSIKDKLIVNFDCVSDGDFITLVLGKRVREDGETVRIIDKSFTADLGKTIVKGGSNKYIYPSDQLHFKKSVAVAAMKKGPLGLYLNRIHTRRDTVFQRENIEFLKKSSLNLISNM